MKPPSRPRSPGSPTRAVVHTAGGPAPGRDALNRMASQPRLRSPSDACRPSPDRTSASSPEAGAAAPASRAAWPRWAHRILLRFLVHDRARPGSWSPVQFVSRRQLGFYSEQEFDLTPFTTLGDRLLELGRACVHQAHRNMAVLGLLWKGIVETREALPIQHQAGRRSSRDDRDLVTWREVGIAILRSPARFLGRAVTLAGAVFRAWVTLAWAGVRASRKSRQCRARRLSLACARGLRVLGVEVQAIGPVPHGGLLVANHVSYLDMLVLASLAPATFVAKSEVASWPVFGRLARLSGAVFVRRSMRLGVRSALAQMREVLQAGGLTVLFPEGTSSDGDQVLPFHPALLASVPAGGVVHVAHLIYKVPGADAGRLVAYWGRMLFGAHLLRLLCLRRIGVEIRFARCTGLPHDRKARAIHLRQAVLDLRDSQEP